MTYLLAALIGGIVLYRLARRADHKLSEPARLQLRALAYEHEERRRRGMEHGYEWEG